MIVGRVLRAPPPLQVDVDAGPGWRAARSLLASAAVGVPLAWVVQRWTMASLPVTSDAVGSTAGDVLRLGNALPLAGWGIAVVVAGGVGSTLWRRLARQEREAPTRRLRWDGAAWSLQADPPGVTRPGTVALVLDLGGWMLVRFRAEATPARQDAPWLALRRSADPSSWCGLRAALWNWRAEPRRAPR